MILMAGCGMGKSTAATNITAYQGYYQSIIDNDKFMNSSSYYSVSGELTQIGDGTYRYYIFLDDAQIAMYNVVLMVVENDLAFDETHKMMPSIGVFEKGSYSLIPNQSRTDAGYVKGLVLSGECDSDSINLKMLVEWRDKKKETVHREYLEFPLTTSGFSAEGSEEATEGETAQ